MSLSASDLRTLAATLGAEVTSASNRVSCVWGNGDQFVFDAFADSIHVLWLQLKDPNRLKAITRLMPPYLRTRGIAEVTADSGDPGWLVTIGFDAVGNGRCRADVSKPFCPLERWSSKSEGPEQ